MGFRLLKDRCGEVWVEEKMWVRGRIYKRW